MHGFIKIFIVLAGLVIAVMISSELAVDTRSLIRFSGYLGFGFFLFGAAMPQQALPFVFAVGTYLEMLKLLAWQQVGSYIDPLVVNLPPICAVAGLSVGALLMLVTGRRRLTKPVLFSWFLSIGFGLVLGVKALSNSGITAGGLGEAANSSAYLMMFAVLGTLFQREEDVKGLLKVISLIVIPSAIYGLYQGIVGYPGFHLDFLAGFRTVKDDSLFIRPNGTMNSAISFANVMGVCFVSIALRGLLNGKLSRFEILLLMLYFSAALISGRRSGFLIVPVFIFAYWCFKSRVRTSLLYGSATAVLLSLYIFAAPLLDFFFNWNRNISSWTVKHGYDDSIVARLGNVGTFTDRLLGFRNMTRNQELWAPFGAELEGHGKFGKGRGQGAGTLGRQGDFEQMRDDFVHDGLNKAIISYGYVPVGVLLIVGSLLLAKFHRLIFRLQKVEERKRLAFFGATLFAMLTLALSSQQALTVFPGNLFIFSVLGSTLWISLRVYQKSRWDNDAVAEDPKVEKDASDLRAPSTNIRVVG